MPVAPGSAIDPAATRGRLLQAALELFAARGVNAVGVAEIAARAGASKLSLYRYFSSKDDLVAAVVTERSQRVQQWLRANCANQTGIEGALGVFDLLGAWFRAQNFKGCAVVNTVTDTRGTPDDRVVSASRSHLQSYRDILLERLADLKPAPADPERLARQLLLLIEGAIVVATIDNLHPTSDARDAAEALIVDAQRRQPRPPRP